LDRRFPVGECGADPTFFTIETQNKRRAGDAFNLDRDSAAPTVTPPIRIPDGFKLDRDSAAPNDIAPIRIPDGFKLDRDSAVPNLSQQNLCCLNHVFRRADIDPNPRRQNLCGPNQTMPTHLIRSEWPFFSVESFEVDLNRRPRV
jgi:hypothetical protein